MKRVETLCAIILDTRILRKFQPQIRKAGFAFVKYWRAKDRLAFDVEYHFRLTFRSREEIVRLKALNPGKSEVRVNLCHCDYIVRNRINSKLALEEVLHHVLVT